VGNDTLDGEEGADFLDGGAGNDRLTARINDTVVGGSGDDVLIVSNTTGGDASGSSLSGGDGADVFQFHLHDDADATVEDFEKGIDLLRFPNLSGFSDLVITYLDPATAVITYDPAVSTSADEWTIKGLSAPLDASDFSF